MAAFRSSSNVVGGSSAAGTSFLADPQQFPTGYTTGDTLYWVVAMKGNSGVPLTWDSTPPSGWSVVADVTANAGRLLVLKYPPPITGTLPNLTFNTSGGVGYVYHNFLVAWSGVTTIGTPVTNSGSSGNGVLSGVGSAGRGIGAWMSIFLNEADVSSTPPSGETEAVDVASASAGLAATMSYSPTATQGGNRTVTFSGTTAPWIGVGIPMDIGGLDVGASLSGVTYPDRHSGLGPFKSSAGAVYFFGRDSGNTGQVEPHKSVIDTQYLTAASTDDWEVYRQDASSYPPGGAVGRVSNFTTTRIEKSAGPPFQVTDMLLKIDTSAIADNVVSAYLRLAPQNAGNNSDSRNLVGEWYDWDGVSDTDYTATPGSTAFSVPLGSGWTTNTFRDIPLTNAPANIDVDGYTYLRISVDGGQPTGTNQMTIYTHDSGGLTPRIVARTFNPLSSFTAQTLKTMSSSTSTAIEAMACCPDPANSDLIHVVTQLATGAVYYNSYDTSTDTWTLTTSEVAVAAASFAPTAQSTYASVAARSNGEVVIAYNAGQTAMSSTFNMLRYTRRTGVNTWTAGVNVDNGGSVGWFGGLAVLGGSDRVHFFFRDSTPGNAFQRTLSAANVLETFPATFLASGATGATMPFLPGGGTYIESGATRVRVMTMGTSGTARLHLVKFDSADVPTVTTESTIADNVIGTTGGNGVAVSVIANAAPYLHLLYADSTTRDLYHDSSTGGGGAWGTDVEEWDAVTINYISANFYFRNSLPKVAVVIDDNATLKYGEIALALPPAPTGLTFAGVVTASD